MRVVGKVRLFAPVIFRVKSAADTCIGAPIAIVMAVAVARFNTFCITLFIAMTFMKVKLD